MLILSGINNYASTDPHHSADGRHTGRTVVPLGRQTGRLAGEGKQADWLRIN